MNKYDLAHQFANVIKQTFIYIQNKAGKNDKLRFDKKHLEVRMFRVRSVPPRYGAYPLLLHTIMHHHASCTRSEGASKRSFPQGDNETRASPPVGELQRAVRRDGRLHRFGALSGTSYVTNHTRIYPASHRACLICTARYRPVGRAVPGSSSKT